MGVFGLKLVVWHEKNRFTEHPIPEAGLSIGRHSDNDIHLEDGMASRVHARVWTEGGKVFIEDLGSTNGTVVAGKNITPKKKYELKENGEIIISSHKIEVTDALKKVVLKSKDDLNNGELENDDFSETRVFKMPKD